MVNCGLYKSNNHIYFIKDILHVKDSDFPYSAKEYYYYNKTWTSVIFNSILPQRLTYNKLFDVLYGS